MGLDLSVQIGSVRLKNPVLPASGTFGFGREMASCWNIGELGGLVSKGVTLLPRDGNPPVRVAECASGMLNSVGLQNPGVDRFIREELPFMESWHVPVIVNAAGHSTEDYVSLGSRLDRTSVSVIELNLSCPNVRTGCMSIGTDPEQIRTVVSAVRAVTRKPLWVKLTPNVTDIAEAALAAEEAGADAVSLINTLLGMRIDVETGRPVLRNNTGGLSGPAVLSVAVRMVHEVYRAVRIPVIGMGGIQSGRDAVEFLMAGASAVQVGTASMNRPSACLRVLRELEQYLEDHEIHRAADLTGSVRLWDSDPDDKGGCDL